MNTTEDLRRWAVETAMTAIRAGSNFDPLSLAQRLVDFVSPPSDERAHVPADFGRRAGEASGEVSRDAIAEREAVAGWLDAQGRSRLARAILAGEHRA